MEITHPSQLPEISVPVAIDTETNGLYADDGARVSVVSAAWVQGDRYEWDDSGYCFEQRKGIPHPVGFSMGEDCQFCRGRIVSVAFPFAQGPHGKHEDNGIRDLFDLGDVNLGEDEWKWLQGWLAARGKTLVYHNAKFDLEKLRVGTMARPVLGIPEFEGRDLSEQTLWDTQIIAKELWPTAGTTSLKPTSVRLWGGDADEEKRALKKYLGPMTNPRYDLVPWDVMRPYAAKDAELTIKLAYYQWDLIEQGLTSRKWNWREIELMKVLYRMEWRGVPYDAAGSLEAAEELERRRFEMVAGLPFYPNQAKDYFFTAKVILGPDGVRRTGADLTPYATTEVRGEPQLTGEIIEQMVQDEVPWAAEFQGVKKIETANKMWYRPYADGIGADGRLRTCFRQVASGRGEDGGTRSQRFSVERVNLQAIPHDYKLSDFAALEGAPTPRQLIARAIGKLEGWNGWELDLAQAELRVAALDAQCEAMLQIIREGRDPHGETATALFGLQKGDGGWDSMRQVAKRGNFSLIFGSGAATFRAMVAKEAGVRLSREEANRIVRDWNALYPEFHDAIERYSREAKRWGRVITANGRPRWFMPGEDTHKAFNQRVQMSLAEYGKDWMIGTDEEMRANGLDELGESDGVGRGGLLLVIHDSQLLLLPEPDGEALALGVKRTGLKLWEQMFPGVPGDIDIKRWAE